MSRVKDVRKERGIKQNAIAKHLKITRQTYARYEDNPELLTIGQAMAICEFLHCDMNDIFLQGDVNLINTKAIPS